MCNCCVVLYESSSKGPQNRAGASVVTRADHPNQRRRPVRRGPVHLLTLYNACQDHQGLPHCSRWDRVICSVSSLSYLSCQPFNPLLNSGKMSVIELHLKIQEFQHGQKSQESPSLPPRVTWSHWPARPQAANQLPESSGSEMTRRSKVSLRCGVDRMERCTLWLLFLLPGVYRGYNLADFQPVLYCCCH